MATETTTSPEMIEAMQRVGGSRWTKNSMDRVYFNGLEELYGLKVDYYNTGNVCSATCDGEKISNSEAKRVISALNDAKVWFDIPTGQFMSRGFDGYLGAGAAKAIIAEIERRMAAARVTA